MHNEEYHNMSSSPNMTMIKSRKMKWAGYITLMEEIRNVYKIWSENLILGRHRYRLGDNIKMDIKKTGWEDKHWIRAAQERDQWQIPVNEVQNTCVP
jgi:hypothetical protein